jgi:hypothetical protein
VKVEWRVILGASLFLGGTCALYWALVYHHGHPTEAAGIAMLLFGFAAYGMLFGYLLLQYIRRHGHPRPEDRFDATQADGEGMVGYFPAASIWPAGLGLGMIFAGAALVWGIWYLIIGGIIFAGAVMGWVVESDYSEDVDVPHDDDGHPVSDDRPESVDAPH